MLNAMAASALEVALNQYLALACDQYQDEPGWQDFQALNGKVVAIDMQGLNASFYLIFNDNHLCVQSHLEGDVDTRISGTPLSLLRMKLQNRQRQQQALFSGDVTISGDTELGRKVNSLLDELDIDWEEHLSRLVGDVLAHEMGSRARELNGWLRASLATLAQDSSEYLREESQLLVSRDELEPFLSAVDELRNDAARIEKRLQRLQHNISGAL